MKKYYNILKEIFLIHKIQAYAYSKERKSLQGYITIETTKKFELDQQRNENKTEQKPIMKLTKFRIDIERDSWK